MLKKNRLHFEVSEGALERMETQSTRCSSISEEIEKFPVGSQVIYWPLVQQTKKQGVKLATGENPWLHPVFGYHFQIWDFLTTWKACLNAKGVVTFGVVLPHVEVKKLEKNGGKGRLQFFLQNYILLWPSMTIFFWGICTSGGQNMWHSPQNIVYQSNFGACQRARLEGQTSNSLKQMNLGLSWFTTSSLRHINDQPLWGIVEDILRHLPSKGVQGLLPLEKQFHLVKQFGIFNLRGNQSMVSHV